MQYFPTTSPLSPHLLRHPPHRLFGNTDQKKLRIWTLFTQWEELKDTRDKYVITPNDKANGNVALICKRFYALTLFRELGITNSQSTNTYEHCKNTNHGTLVKKYSDDLSKYFRISVSEDYLTYTRKNPTKAKFIIAASTCPVKLLSKYIISVFKLIFNQVKSYNKRRSFFSGVNFFRLY